MVLTSTQWIEASLSLFIVSIFSFFIVIPSLNIEAQPESINVQNTIVTAPLTVVVPITVDAQNAQICVSAGSTGDQSCTQVIVNPEQTVYTPVNADLTEPGTPTVSSAVEQEPTTTTTTATTTEPTATTTQTAPTTTTEPTAPTTTDEGAATTTTE